MKIYEVPDTISDLFEEVDSDNGYMSYRIINYSDNMSMDNMESMRHFIDCVGINEDFIEEDLGTQVTLKHPDYRKRIIIDSGGLGDFFSHGFNCYWHEDDMYEFT